MGLPFFRDWPMLRGAGHGALPGSLSSRRGQTRLESAMALAVLIVAGIGFWMLYKDSILETTKAMIAFFGSNKAS